MGWHAAGGQADAARGLAGAAWGLGAAAVSAGLPLLAVLAGVRRGWWTDVHVSVREQRMVPLAVAIGANLAGLGLLALAHAPRPLLALVLAVLGGLVAGAAITAGWKISGHTGAAAAAMTVLAASYGQWTLLALPLVALIAWSRVAAGDHTWAQAAGGLLLGAAVAAGVFIPLSLIRHCL